MAVKPAEQQGVKIDGNLFSRRGLCTAPDFLTQPGVFRGRDRRVRATRVPGGVTSRLTDGLFAAFVAQNLAATFVVGGGPATLIPFRRVAGLWRGRGAQGGACGGRRTGSGGCC